MPPTAPGHPHGDEATCRLCHPAPSCAECEDAEVIEATAKLFGARPHPTQRRAIAAHRATHKGAK